MGAHDREITEGREQTIEGGVILRFPGDWVGPLEELVPFGPAADREASPTGPDFWGEDSAALQDAVEASEEATPAPHRAVRDRRWLLSAGAALAAVLFAVAAALGGSGSTAPRVHGMAFATASIPPLAPAAPAVRERPTRRRGTARPRRHAKSTAPPTVATHGSASSSPVTTPAAPSSPTPSPVYHPAPTSASSGASSSQSGGAFTLGGP